MSHPLIAACMMFIDLVRSLPSIQPHSDALIAPRFFSFTIQTPNVRSIPLFTRHLIIRNHHI